MKRSLALEALRAEVRELWGRVTPYRLGMLVGVCGKQVVNPYGKVCSCAACQFERGRIVGERLDG